MLVPDHMFREEIIQQFEYNASHVVLNPRTEDDTESPSVEITEVSSGGMKDQ